MLPCEYFEFLKAEFGLPGDVFGLKENSHGMILVCEKDRQVALILMHGDESKDPYRNWCPNSVTLKLQTWDKKAKKVSFSNKSLSFH